MLTEDQLQITTADRQLLFDIRSESRKTNELLSQLLEVLRPIAKDTVQAEELKEDNNNVTLPISEGSSNSKPSRSSTKPANKRKAVPGVKHRSTTAVPKPKSNGNGSKRVSSASHDTNADKNNSKK